jgi:hypothetical protein
MRTSAFIALIAIVAVGCTAAAGSAEPSDTSLAVSSPSIVAPSNSAAASAEPSARVEPSASASSTPTPPPPSVPPDLVRVAVKERDDIRVEVELQRNPLPAGEPSWVKVRVTNQGRTDVTWFHGGCAEPVFVQGVSKVAWSMGEEQQAQAAMFKTYALGGHIAAAPDPHGVLSFVPKSHLNTGPTGCADVGITEKIKPGETVRATRWWAGVTDLNRALPAAGPVTFRAFADYYWRGKEPTSIPDKSIKLRLDAWIVSDAAAARLSPAQAVDAALSDPDFAAYLDTQTIANGRAAIAWYDAHRDLWEIGVMPWYETEPPRIHGVLVDAVTGAIRGPLDRPWEHDVDPFP